MMNLFDAALLASLSIAAPAAPTSEPVTHLSGATVIRIDRIDVRSGVIIFLHTVLVRTKDLKIRQLFSTSMDGASDPLPPVGAVCDFGIVDLPSGYGIHIGYVAHEPEPSIVSHTCDRADE